MPGPKRAADERSRKKHHKQEGGEMKGKERMAGGVRLLACLSVYRSIDPSIRPTCKVSVDCRCNLRKERARKDGMLQLLNRDGQAAADDVAERGGEEEAWKSDRTSKQVRQAGRQAGRQSAYASVD